jgi:molybdopterin-guanine dinucleotide biosynthesis protein A
MVTNFPTTDAAIVLCGGRSTRMGRDKLSLPFGTETMLARVLRTVRQVVPDVVLVAREGQALPAGLEAVRDPAEGLGPVAAIATGLSSLNADRAIAVACDMPLLRPAVLRRLLDLAEGWDACVPVVDGFAVPTCAVYRCAIGAVARDLVAARELRPAALLERVNTRYVEAADLREVDPALESFRDCNTPERYRGALRLAGLDPA